MDFLFYSIFFRAIFITLICVGELFYLQASEPCFSNERAGADALRVTLIPVTSSCTTPRCTLPIITSIHWLWTWLDVFTTITSRQAVRLQDECSHSAQGANRFSGGRSVGRGEAALLILLSRWTKVAARASVARLHGGHCGVRGEGLVILVAWSRAGRLWGRALISTNRFLIRASRALHPRTHLHTNCHMGTHTRRHTLLAVQACACSNKR